MLAARPTSTQRAADLVVATLVACASPRPHSRAMQTPEQFFGFRIGTDNKLARWDKIVDYMKLVVAGERPRPLPRAGQVDQRQSVHRARDREPGHAEEPRSLQAARAEAVLPGRRADRRRARRDLPSGQGGRRHHQQHPRDRDRRLADGRRAGAPAGDRQLAAGEEDPRQRDLRARPVPESGRPDHGHRLVQQERRHAVRDEPDPVSLSPVRRATTTIATCTCSRRRRASSRRSCCGTTGSRRSGSTSTRRAATRARIFVMPATDPINPNVHPLIYRWNGILGQSQAAALEAAGKDGIIYNSTYTNFWEGAMAWSGWWHNEVGLLTEVASVRVAAPIDQQRAIAERAAGASRPGAAPAAAVAVGAATPASTARQRRCRRRPTSPAHRISAALDGRPLDAPRHRRLRADRHDGAARYRGRSPRSAAAADLRGQSRHTSRTARKGEPPAILIPVDTQHDPHEALHLVEKLQDGRRRGLARRCAVRGRRQSLRRRAPSSCR